MQKTKGSNKWGSNRKKAFKISILVAVLFCGLYIANTSAQAAWKHNGVGWWWQRANGSYPAKEWQFINNRWYYFNAGGYMQTGWVLDGNRYFFLNQDGIMQTGWRKVYNDWYYMNANGEMQRGWLTLGSRKYYLNGSGQMLTGTHTISGQRYTFHRDGYLTTQAATQKNGWKLEGGHYYYYVNNVKATGWRQVYSDWYYLNASGQMQTGWLTLGANKYYLNGSGQMLTGIHTISGQRYNFGNDGILIVAPVQNVLPTSVEVSGESSAVVGSTIQLSAVVAPSNATNKNVTWSSDNPRIATVDQNGLVTIIGGDYDKGIIRATTSNGIVGTKSIMIYRPQNVQTYTIDLGNGQTQQIYGYFDRQAEARHVELLNAYRVENGLAPLQTVSRLQAASDIRAVEITHTYNPRHSRPNGLSCFSIDPEVLHGENMSIESFGTMEQIANDPLRGFQSSAGHNANMLKAENKSMSVSIFVPCNGRGIPNGRPHVVQVFSRH